MNKESVECTVAEANIT